MASHTQEQRTQVCALGELYSLLSGACDRLLAAPDPEDQDGLYDAIDDMHDLATDALRDMTGANRAMEGLAHDARAYSQD